MPATPSPRTEAKPSLLLRLRLPLLVSSAALILTAVYLSLLWTPTLTEGFSAPVAQRVFYFHFAAAITSYVAFSAAFVASLLYLRKREARFDALASHCAGVALLFTAQTLIAGSLWGWAEWGVAWRFEDVRLDTYLVLALVFVAYFAARQQIPEGDARARTAALIAVAGFVLVPFSYLSIYLFQSLHPRVISPGGQGVGAPGGVALAVALVGFLLLFVALLASRLELSRLEERVSVLQREVDT